VAGAKQKPKKRKPKTEPDNPAQSARFIEGAKALGADESGQAFKRAVDAILPRAKQLQKMSAALVADVAMYSTSNGGRESPALPGWGCPCMVSKGAPYVGYDGWPLLGDTPLNPGDQRRLGFVFLSGEEAARIMRAAGKFYLWEGRIIGEATVVE